MFTHTLSAPLFTFWSEQYFIYEVPGASIGQPLTLKINGEETPFQYTGEEGCRGAYIMLHLGFEKGEEKELTFEEADESDTDLSHQSIPLEKGVTLGTEANPLSIAPPEVSEDGVHGPFGGFAGFPMESRIQTCGTLLETTLTSVNRGPLFEDYVLTYNFSAHRVYEIRLRCYHHNPYIEVAEDFSLQMDSSLTWTWNPEKTLDHIVSHRGRDFEGEGQPIVEPLGTEPPADVVCRLQMPTLSDYAIPNNRGWFGFFNSTDEDRGMIGVVGLYGWAWLEPVVNMPEILDRGGRTTWQASLVSGSRYWLLYAGPVEKSHTPEDRLIFHRINAEWNMLRLQDHLDLTGHDTYDASCFRESGIFNGNDPISATAEGLQALEAVQRSVEEVTKDEAGKDKKTGSVLQMLVDPSEENCQAAYNTVATQFRRWVHQFQGYREGKGDFRKSIIGFARKTRMLLITYEALRKYGCLSEAQVKELNAYFGFAARKLGDEGFWPTSKTHLHPDHPESVRDFHTYGGEHKPDRLVWTNSLPNFQSDPMCALAHISALFPDHPNAYDWRRKALDDVERQLTAYAGDSGAWEESINYSMATLAYFIITFRVLKRRFGIDYFNDPRVRRFVGWLCRFFGIYDKRFGYHTWPGVGNSKLPQRGGHILLAFAGELAEDDQLRHHCIAVYQRQKSLVTPTQEFASVIAAIAPIPDGWYELPHCTSEHMDEVGVAMRDRNRCDDESYLFQKIGFSKDHYENDETAFNWYAKGTPFMMDYGTYTKDAGRGASHNRVEIPDQDSLRRGFMANKLFSPAVDFTHSEVPVTLKLQWGRVRTFDEIDGKVEMPEGSQPLYNYIGDPNPVGPKTWQVRYMLFIKPDYLVLFDRVYGNVPHRLNLHVTAEEIQQKDDLFQANGRFDLDFLGFVQHPRDFDWEQGEFTPTVKVQGQHDPEEARKHRQSYLRIYNHNDNMYRSVMFARERERDVSLESAGEHGIKITTPEYVDYVFMHNDTITEEFDDVSFTGRTGWIRWTKDNGTQAALIEGERLEAFGTCLRGLGPWTYNCENPGEITGHGGPPRRIDIVEGGQTTRHQIS